MPHKPAKDLLDLVLDLVMVEHRAGLPFTDVRFVGGTDIDMICATNHGCLTILTENPATEDEFSGCDLAFLFEKNLVFSHQPDTNSAAAL